MIFRFDNLPLFSTLDSMQIDNLKPIFYHKDYNEGEIVFLEGKEADIFYIILEGEIQISKVSREGKEKILKILGPGNFFGEMGIVEDKKRSATATTRSNTRVLAVNREDFMNFISKNPEITFKIIVELSRRLRHANREIEGLAFMDVSARLKQVLRHLAGEAGDELVISRRITHQELAKLLGTSRETVTRIINDLRTKEMLEIKEHKIFLKNIDRW